MKVKRLANKMSRHLITPTKYNIRWKFAVVNSIDYSFRVTLPRTELDDIAKPVPAAVL